VHLDLSLTVCYTMRSIAGTTAVPSFSRAEITSRFSRRSSYRLHGMGRDEPLLTPLPIWESLGKDEAKRQAYWRDWVHTPFTEPELAVVRLGRQRPALRQ
jgi:hypothetical protein